MATVTGMTADRMLAIEAASIVDGTIDGSGHLILTAHDGTEIDAGYMIASVPDASTTVKGIVELATNAETILGTDTVRAVTPAAFAAAIAATVLNALSDVVITAAAADNVLQFDGTNWVNRATLHATGATTGDDALQSKVTGDGVDRFVLDVDGRHNWGDGTNARDLMLYRFAAAYLYTNGDLGFSVVGKGIRITEGTNAKMGLAVLVAGTVTVNTTVVTASSRIFLTNNVAGGTPGFLRISARVAGTSFTITSSSASDTSSVAWMIVEPT